MTELQSKLEQSERRATFAEEAQRPEIGCLNAKAAYALAVAENLFDRRKGQSQLGGVEGRGAPVGLCTGQRLDRRWRRGTTSNSL